ncbi:MAG: autotransporter outer membrane beta-barrel domain-containing protein, partial [Mailhella sp.]|nr:autotransporter outer membrane beta-barrel domain-containing protein [Mailhella sp.]
VSAEAASGEGALVGDGSSELYVAPDAKLHLQDAAAGKTYTVTSGFKKQEILGWQGGNLSTNSLIDARGEVSDGTFRITTTALPAAEVLPGSMIPKTLDALIAGGSHSVLASSASILFLSRAVDSLYLPQGQEDRLNEVSRAAVTAGVQNTSLKVAHAAGESIEHHLSLGWHDREGVIHRDVLDAWASPMYGNTYTGGLAIRGGAVRGNYGGVAAGLDSVLGSLWGGDFRLGFAIHGGGGKAHVGGMVTDTHDSYNFGGFHLYSGWRLGGLNIMAQAGYAVSSHDMKMNLPVSMRMGRIKADIDTHALTAAMRLEHAFHAGPVDIIPHAGVRWTALTTEQHDLKIKGEKINTVRSDAQNVVQFPVGITLAKDIRIGGWDVKPRLDLNVTPAAGGKKAVTKLSYAGVDAWDSMRSRVMDSVTYGGLAGVQASKGSMSFGVDYGIQAGRHERDQRVRLSFSYKF